MCVPGCHAAVHSRLDRRGLFKAGAAALAAGTLASAATPSRAAGLRVFNRVVDLTHTLTPDFPTYLPDWALGIEQTTTFAENGFNTRRYTLTEHSGTHVDAPIHFTADGATLDEIPLEDLVLPLVVVDVKAQAASNPDYQLTPEDLMAWEAKHGRIPDGACVAMNSGWAEKAPGEGFANKDAEGVMHFPGFHVDSADMLMSDRGALGIASDTLSLDHGASQTFDTHYAWLPSGRWGVECIAGLDDVPPAGATLVAAAPKIGGATGMNSRLIALV